MLAALPTGHLARLRFPLAPYRKPEVREIATAAGLPVASRPESQDLCFLAGVGKQGFLQRHGGLRPRRGEIRDSSGRRLGDHEGHHNFTVGQRRGIGLGAPEPLYVLATDARANTVTVGTAAELGRRNVTVGGADPAPAARRDRRGQAALPGPGPGLLGRAGRRRRARRRARCRDPQAGARSDGRLLRRRADRRPRRHRLIGARPVRFPPELALAP